MFLENDFCISCKIENESVCYRNLAGFVKATAAKGGGNILKPLGLGTTATQLTNRWELQGKERDLTFGLNRINFGARVYNPTIGVWDQVDPLADERVWVSPYNFNQNNPINRIDPTGALDEPCCGETGAAVSGFLEGVGESVVRNVKALTVNLPETLQGMASLSSPMGQFQTAIGAGMLYEKTKSDWNTGDTRTRANIVGNVVGEIGIAVAGSKGAGSLGKAGVVSDVVKVSEVANVEKSVGGVISGYTRHGLNQAIGRDAGRGVKATEMLDAVKNPNKVVNQSNGGIRYEGSGAKVVVNSDGKVISTFGKSRGEAIYTHGKGNNALNRAKELGIEYDPKKIR